MYYGRCASPESAACRVTCLRAIGDRAIVGGVVTRDKLDLASDPIEGTGSLGMCVDNDQVSGGADGQSNSTPGRRGGCTADLGLLAASAVPALLHEDRRALLRLVVELLYVLHRHADAAMRGGLAERGSVVLPWIPWPS